MRFAILLAATLLAAPAFADEQPVELKPGPGLETVNANCAGCHSLDYVRMNSPFLTADAWKAEVGKMRASFGAPIDDADAATIAAYLAENYGVAK
jgi:mono/diheme cytochrome c family protein